MKKRKRKILIPAVNRIVNRSKGDKGGGVRISICATFIKGTTATLNINPNQHYRKCSVRVCSVPRARQECRERSWSRSWSRGIILIGIGIFPVVRVL